MIELDEFPSAYRSMRGAGGGSKAFHGVIQKVATPEVDDN
jgi:hypothetical protein